MNELRFCKFCEILWFVGLSSFHSLDCDKSVGKSCLHERMFATCLQEDKRGLSDRDRLKMLKKLGKDVHSEHILKSIKLLMDTNSKVDCSFQYKGSIHS